MTEKYETEMHLRVYDNRHGDCIVIRPDGDALGLIQITAVESSGVVEQSMIIGPPEQAELVAKAILRLCEDIRARHVEKT